MRSKLVLAAVILMFGFCAQAHAVTILDTGAGPETQGGWVLSNGQWLANEFAIGQNYTITSAYGWIANYNGGTAHLIIYGDGGDVPDASNELYSGQFSVPSNYDYTANWYGLSGLDWDLGAGSYWLAFEVRSGDTYYGAMPFPSAYPDRSVNDAYSSTANNNVWYTQNGTLDLGVRIYADEGETVVPEPASMALLGLGLVGTLYRRVRKG